MAEQRTASAAVSASLKGSTDANVDASVARTPASPGAASVASVNSTSAAANLDNVSRDDLLKLSSKLTRRLRSVENRLKRAAAANAALEKRGGALCGALRVVASALSEDGAPYMKIILSKDSSTESIAEAGKQLAQSTQDAVSDAASAEERATLAKELAASRELTQQLMKSNKDLKAERDRATSQSAVHASRAQTEAATTIAKLEADRASEREKCADAERRVIAFEGECARLKEMIGDLGAEARGSRAQIAELRTGIAEARKEAEEARSRGRKDHELVSRLKDQLAQAQASVERFKVQATRAEKDAKAQRRLSALKLEKFAKEEAMMLQTSLDDAQ